MSRAIAAQPVKQYLSRGHARLVRTSRLMGKDLWSATLAGSSPIAIHRAAVSLVAGSQPPWREVLAGLPMPRTVIFGTRSLPDPDTRRLRASGVAVRVVPDAGHDMAAENPGGLARALAAAIA